MSQQDEFQNYILVPLWKTDIYSYSRERLRNREEYTGRITRNMRFADDEEKIENVEPEQLDVVNQASKKVKFLEHVDLENFEVVGHVSTTMVKGYNQLKTKQKRVYKDKKIVKPEYFETVEQGSKKKKGCSVPKTKNETIYKKKEKATLNNKRNVERNQPQVVEQTPKNLKFDKNKENATNPRTGQGVLDSALEQYKSLIVAEVINDFMAYLKRYSTEKKLDIVLDEEAGPSSRQD